VHGSIKLTDPDGTSFRSPALSGLGRVPILDILSCRHLLVTLLADDAVHHIATVCRHFGYRAQPQNELPTLRPFFAVRTTIRPLHLGHMGAALLLACASTAPSSKSDSAPRPSPKSASSP
jgi:hypothetical protein